MPHPPEPTVDGADPSSAAPEPLRAVADEPVPRRHCGRCRGQFDGDPTLHPLVQAGWWLCPPCRAILLDRTPHPDSTHRGHADRAP